MMSRKNDAASCQDEPYGLFVSDMSKTRKLRGTVPSSFSAWTVLSLVLLSVTYVFYFYAGQSPPVSAKSIQEPSSENLQDVIEQVDKAMVEWGALRADLAKLRKSLSDPEATTSTKPKATTTTPVSTTNAVANSLKTEYLVRRSSEQATPLNPNKQLVVIKFPKEVAGTKIWVHDPHECVYISRSLIRRGKWEPELQERLMEVMEPPAHFVDIGGNIGTFSIIMAAAGYQVEAFEPMEYNVELFSRSIHENDFLDKIKLFHVAVGETPQPKVCLTPQSSTEERPNIGNAQVREDAPDNGNNCVPMVRVDSLVSRCPDIVKVDVEGFELSALKSLGIDHDGSCRPKGIAVEDLLYGRKRHTESTGYYLEQLGYTCEKLPGPGNYFCSFA